MNAFRESCAVCSPKNAEFAVLLYIHVPFCRAKCPYCAFASQRLSTGLEDLYVQALCREIKHQSEWLENHAISTVYLGGGTPSILSPKSLDKIFTALTAGFSLESWAEITLEANPESACSPEFFGQIRSLGVNRVSLGVQCLDDRILAAIGRLHSSKEAMRSIELAQSCGLENINTDLIWSLPGQSLGQWLGQLKQITRMGVRHISSYGLTMEPGTHLAKAVDKGEVLLPDEEEQARMYVLGAEFLESTGRIQYEISNFCAMGYASRHNSGYWNRDDYLGLGPAAVSTINGRRWTNPFPVKKYAAAPPGPGPGNGAFALTLPDKINEFIMLSLRTSRGLNLKEYAHLIGRDLRAENKKAIQSMHSAGLIRLTATHLRLTKTGMAVSNQIIAHFMLDALDRGKQRKQNGGISWNN